LLDFIPSVAKSAKGNELVKIDKVGIEDWADLDKRPLY